MPGEPQPQRQVDVLPVGEERLVEAADFSECVGAEGSRPAARPDRLGGRCRAPRRSGSTRRPTTAASCRARSRRNRRALARSCWSRTPATMATLGSWSGSSSRSRKSGSQITSLLISTTTSVVATATPRLTARPKPAFCRQPDDAHAGEPLGEELGRSVGRPVVDDDDVVRDRLACEPVERLREQPSAVEGRNDDGRGHVVHDSASGERLGDDPRPTLDACGGRSRRARRACARSRLWHRNAARGRDVGLPAPLSRPSTTSAATAPSRLCSASSAGSATPG